MTGIWYLPVVKVKSHAEMLADGWQGFAAMAKARRLAKLDARWRNNGKVYGRH